MIFNPAESLRKPFDLRINKGHLLNDQETRSVRNPNFGDSLTHVLNTHTDFWIKRFSRLEFT